MLMLLLLRCWTKQTRHIRVYHYTNKQKYRGCKEMQTSPCHLSTTNDVEGIERTVWNSLPKKFKSRIKISKIYKLELWIYIQCF